MSSRHYSAILCVVVILLLGLAGCFNITVPGPATSTPTTTSPVTTTPSTTPSTPATPLPSNPAPGLSDNSAALPSVILFVATPGTILAGDSSMLNWSVSNASSITISPGIGSVGYLNGNVSVTPSSTTDYVLTASNDAGAITAIAEIAVSKIVGLPVINYFTAAPPSLFIGSSTLSWSVSNATAVSISPGVGNVGSTGSTSVTPGSTTIYTLTASNPAGTMYHTIQITKLVLQAVPHIPINPNVTPQLSLPVNPNFKLPVNSGLLKGLGGLQGN